MALAESGACPRAVRSADSRQRLADAFFLLNGRLPSAHALRYSIDCIEALASHAEIHPVHLRISEHAPECDNHVLHIDLANPRGESISITPDGWTIETSATTQFRRSPAALPLPTPEPDPHASLEPLRALLNIPSDQDWLRTQMWLLSALNPAGPYPVLVLEGPATSGKTVAAKMLRALIDPDEAAVSPLLNSQKAIFEHALRNRVVAFDNVARLSPQKNAAVCMISSGIGYQFREHARGDYMSVNISRPILLATPNPKLHADLGGRALTVQMPAIENPIPETDLMSQFEQIRPTLLAALCNFASQALKRRPTMHMEDLPRMADAALWCAAGLTNIDPEEIGDAFLPWRDAERDAFTVGLEQFLAERIICTGSATELLHDLQAAAIPGLPANARALSQRLRRLDSPIIEIAFTRLPGGPRRIRLSLSRVGGSACPIPETAIPLSAVA
jgi:hypothetical protein